MLGCQSRCRVVGKAPPAFWNLVGLAPMGHPISGQIFVSFGQRSVLSAIDLHIADAGDAHFAEGGFLRVGRHGRGLIR